MYVKDIDGKWHTIIDQAKGSSCGPACVRMVAKMSLGKDIGEEMVRRLIEIDEGRATVATITSEKGGAAVAGSHNWGNHGGFGKAGGGSGTWNLPNVLRGLGVKNARMDTGYVRNAFKKTSRQNPGIAVVGWSAGWNASGAHGKHWVVVAGTVSDGRLLILDPAFGLQYVSLGPAVLQYTPKAGVAGTFEQKTVLTGD